MLRRSNARTPQMGLRLAGAPVLVQEGQNVRLQRRLQRQKVRTDSLCGNLLQQPSLYVVFM